MRRGLAFPVAGIALGVLGACVPGTTRVEGEDMVADLFIGDMAKSHDAAPAGVGGADWGRHARPGYREVPEGWSCAVMWGQIYPPQGGALPENVRVQIRDARLWYLSHRDGQWHQLQNSVGVNGAAFRLDFANDENVRADLRREEDGTVSVRMTPGYNFHFWPTDARADLDPGDVAAMASSFTARLIVDDASRPADLARARLIGSCGGDFWRAQGAAWKADWSNNGDWAIGRFKLITREWKLFTATNAEEATVRSNPPPLPLVGQSE